MGACPSNGSAFGAPVAAVPLLPDPEDDEDDVDEDDDEEAKAVAADKHGLHSQPAALSNSRCKKQVKKRLNHLHAFGVKNTIEARRQTPMRRLARAFLVWAVQTRASLISSVSSETFDV
jgi:hypothetical protein